MGWALRPRWRSAPSWWLPPLVLAACGSPREPRSPAGEGESLCSTYGPAITVGALQCLDLTEISGLAASRRNPGVLWGHNDSGDGPRIFALSQKGDHLGSFHLVGAQAIDWEELTHGPAPGRKGDFLYVGDIGGNRLLREEVTVYRIPEPEVIATEPPREHAVEELETFVLVYPAGGRYDAETLLVDPISAEVLLVTKDPGGHSRVFHAPPLVAPAGKVHLEDVGEVRFEGPTVSDRLATGGDVSDDGSWVVVRTYVRPWLFTRPRGAPLSDAFRSRPCALPASDERQGESFTFAADGGGYYTASEGRGASLHFAPRRASGVNEGR